MFSSPLPSLSDVFPPVVREKTSSGFYAAVLAGTVCIFGGVGYLLVKELWETYPLVDEAVALIKDDPILRGSLGRQLSVFGPGDGRRRRPFIHASLGPDGRQLVEASFYVQDEQGTRGKVSLHAVEREPGRWEKQLLAVDIPGRPTHYLIRPAPKVQPSLAGWNPFSRWFSQ